MRRHLINVKLTYYIVQGGEKMDIFLLMVVRVLIPSKHETFTQCRYNVGPASCLLCCNFSVQRADYSAKPKGSNCLLYKSTVTVFWLSKEQLADPERFRIASGLKVCVLLGSSSDPRRRDVTASHQHQHARV